MLLKHIKIPNEIWKEVDHHLLNNINERDRYPHVTKLN